MDSGIPSFLQDENAKSKKFLSKPRKLLQNGDQAEFNGVNLKLDDEGVYHLVQDQKLSSLTVAQDRDDFVSTRAKAQYIGNCTRPDICAAVQLLASSTTTPEEKDYKSLEAVVRRCNATANVGLKYVPLDMKTLRLVLFTDASFANTKNLKSQIGFVFVLTDDQRVPM